MSERDEELIEELYVKLNHLLIKAETTNKQKDRSAYYAWRSAMETLGLLRPKDPQRG